MTRKLNALTRFGDEFDNLSKEFDNLSHFFGFPTMRGIENNMYIPPINIVEKKDNYTIISEIPGITKEDVEISILEDDTIIFKGEKLEKKIENEEILSSEISYGAFRRELRISKNIDKEKISASYENGVLKIILPKKEKKEIETKQIKIT